MVFKKKKDELTNKAKGELRQLSGECGREMILKIAMSTILI